MDQYQAAKLGDLRWFQEHHAQQTLPDLCAAQDTASIDQTENCVELAARYGHLELLRWFICESGQQLDLTMDHNVLVRTAAENGDLDMLRWLVIDSGQAVDVTARDNFALYHAARNGHFAVVKWLVEDSGQPIDVTAAGRLTKPARLLEVSKSIRGYLLAIQRLVDEFGLDQTRQLLTKTPPLTSAPRTPPQL